MFWYVIGYILYKLASPLHVLVNFPVTGWLETLIHINEGIEKWGGAFFAGWAQSFQFAPNVDVLYDQCFSVMNKNV